MSIIDFKEVAARLTKARLNSYLEATSDDVEAAIRLYDWNTGAAGALHEYLGRLEVVFRNAWVATTSRTPTVIAARPWLSVAGQPR